MKHLLLLALIALSAIGCRAEITYFYEMGGDFSRTDTITLTQTGQVYIQTGGNITTLNQSGPGDCYIYVDGTRVAQGLHSVRDASTTTTMAVYVATLGPGNHSIETGIESGQNSDSSFTYIRLEDESGPLDQSTITQITNLYQSADDQLRSDLTTIIQNAETDLQNQINATNANVTQLQQRLTALIQQVAANQSGDDAAISQLQQQIASDEAAIAALQSQAADQQAQLQTLNGLEQSHYASLQSQITALSHATVHKSSMTTYLLYGAAGAGVGGLGIGLYSLFDQPASSPRPATSHLVPSHAK